MANILVVDDDSVVSANELQRIRQWVMSRPKKSRRAS